ncbi:MAG: C39 family peptidase [Desulfomonilia bacterium]
MRAATRIGLASVMIAALATAFWTSPADAVQPYEDPWFQPVSQGPSQCGPACFYMIFNHYGAHQVFTECDLSEHPELMSAYGYEITSDTAICRWINGGKRQGTTWKQLKQAADGLHAPGSTQAYFTSELQSDTTPYNSPAADEERMRRLDYIKREYLDRNRPVIIHMRRVWYLPGHYLVLTGYDPASGMVYYADPSNGGMGEISRESFVRDKWYASPVHWPGYPRARWDGEWMGFY